MSTTTTMKPNLLNPKYSYPYPHSLVTGNALVRFPGKPGSCWVRPAHPTPMQPGSRGPSFERPPHPSLF